MKKPILRLVKSDNPQLKVLANIENIKLIHTINTQYYIQPYGIVSLSVKPSQVRTTWDDIVDFVCRRHGYNVRFMLWHKHRQRRFVRARWEVWSLANLLCPHLSYPQMGRLSGGRDHTTIMHGINSMKAMGLTEKLLDDFYSRNL